MINYYQLSLFSFLSDPIVDCVNPVTQANKDADSMPDENNICDIVVAAYDSILDENYHCDLVPELMLILTFKC